eukprot:TRINITY_DN15441_c0_g1_i2.p1 TRINITY_DN15441_c0_g1~~TRINITY_DN15441_c0_g1_i2.p1  ORF type:complete len:124 (-),score=29.94 TRINITY_DN15441_c0_g1_i2:106-477(-)
MCIRDRTAVLCNRYPEGEGEIPWHSDEVRAHGPAKVVASLSLGGPRHFELKRHEAEDSELEAVLLEPGSVLLMAGTTQESWLHRLPLTGGDRERISLTMRSIVPGYEAGRPTIVNDRCSPKFN